MIGPVTHAVSAFGALPLENAVFRWIVHARAGLGLLDRLVEWLLTAHLVKFVPLELAVCGFWFARSPQQAERRTKLLALLQASIAALFVARALAALLPFRDRPFLDPDLAIPLAFEPGLRTWSSFPSDHAVLAAALVASLYRLSPKVALWAGLHALVFICLPRLYFGLHYPSDLVGGAIIGAAIALAWPRLPLCDALTARALDWEHRFPGAFHAVGFVLLFEIAEMFTSVRWLVGGVFHALREALS